MTVSLPKILMVEDNETLAKAVRGWLEELAFTVEHCANAEDGLESLDAGDHAALLLDLSLPGMNGHAMIRQLRRVGHKLPVIVMSGVGDMDDVVKLLRADIADYLAKPFRMVELEAALERSFAKVPLLVPRARCSVPAAAPPEPTPVALPETPSLAVPSVRSAIADLQKELEDGTLELPVVDPRTAELRAFLGRDDYSLSDVVDVVGSEPGLASVIMRTANSAFYSRGRKIENLRDACVWIGPKLVVGMSLEATLRNQHLSIREPFREILEKMTRNATISARVAMLVGRLVRRKDESELFVLALLHNFGETLSVQLLSELHAGDQAEYSIDEMASEVERIHEAFGLALANSWDLPPVFARFAGDHHKEPKQNAAEEQTRQILLASWGLALQAGFTYFPNQTGAEADEHLDSLGVSGVEIAKLLEEIDSWAA